MIDEVLVSSSVNLGANGKRNLSGGIAQITLACDDVCEKIVLADDWHRWVQPTVGGGTIPRQVWIVVKKLADHKQGASEPLSSVLQWFLL